MKLTKKHFEQFKKYCLAYQKQFGLDGWKLAFEFKELTDSHAETAFNLEGSQATIALTNNWTDRIVTSSNEVLKSTAKHELLHILLGRMGELAQYRYIQRRELDAAEHDVINKLKMLIPDL